MDKLFLGTSDTQAGPSVRDRSAFQ